MAEIGTREGETLPEKHARLEHETLTPEEDRFIEAESALDSARTAWDASDKRTTESNGLLLRYRKAQTDLDAARDALGPL